MSVVLEKELPKGWCIATLGDVSDVLGGKRLPKGHGFSEVKSNHPYLRVTDFENFGINENSLKFLKPETHELIKNYTISSNDVYISIAGNLGKSGIVPPALNGANLTENSAKFTKIKIDQKYLGYLVYSDICQNQISKLKTSSVQPKLALFRIKNMVVPISPINEQKRIVAKIEELFSLVDSAKENLEKTKILLKQYRQSILKHAFEGKLTEEWRAGNKKIIEKEKKAQKEISLEVEDLKRKTRQEFGTLCGNELFEIPDEWIWARFVNVAKIGQGGTPSTAMKEYWNGDIPWLRSGNVRNNFITASNVFITKLGLQNSSTTLCSQGTVLLAMTGEGLTRGRSAVLEINACANQSVAHIITNNKRIFNKFVFYYLQFQYWKIRSVYKGSNQPGLNVSIIKQFEIPIPSIPEQVLIVQKIEESFSIIEKNEKLVDTLLQQFYQMKNSILKQAFEGRLVPQDPNDEPAQILLERIQQERKKNGK